MSECLPVTMRFIAVPGVSDSLQTGAELRLSALIRDTVIIRTLT